MIDGVVIKINNIPLREEVGYTIKFPKWGMAYKFEAQERIKVLSFTNQVPELMSISSLVVTKPGGMTTTESLASHLPMLIINPIPGQEEENAEFLESKGVGIWIKKDTDVNTLLNSIFSNPDKLEKMKQNTNILAKPNSTKNICEILIN